MSKSASSPAGIIELLDDPKVSAKKIRSAVTDSGTDVRFDLEEKPGRQQPAHHLLRAHRDRRSSDLEEQYGGSGYGKLKGDLADAVVEFVTPFRNRTLELLDDRDQLDAIIRDGTERARAIAEATLRDVVDRVGFLPDDPALGSCGAHHRSRRGHSRALGAGAAGLPDLDRRPHRHGDPHARDVGAAGRGRGRGAAVSSSDTSGSAATEVGPVPDAAARDRHVPPGLAGRLRRRSPRGSRSARRWRTPYAAVRSRRTCSSRTTRT